MSSGSAKADESVPRTVPSCRGLRVLQSPGQSKPQALPRWLTHRWPFGETPPETGRVHPCPSEGAPGPSQGYRPIQSPESWGRGGGGGSTRNFFLSSRHQTSRESTLAGPAPFGVWWPDRGEGGGGAHWPGGVRSGLSCRERQGSRPLKLPHPL